MALLALVDSSFENGRKSLDNVEIQKISFLTELSGQEKDLKAAYYRFYRYKHGPFCTALVKDVNCLEGLGIIDPESREILGRGHYLIKHLLPEVNKSKEANEALQIISSVSREWKDVRGWEIVKKVYEIPVPVQGREGKMLMGEIPLYVDIIDPEKSHGRDVSPFSEETIKDIMDELAIPLAKLDTNSEEVWRHSAESLRAVFAN